MLELLIALLGLIIGSFLNVCIYRLPQNQSVVNPPSHCMACDTRLKPWDLIPVVSYLVLRGRCHTCGTRFSGRYMLVELLTAVLFVWCFKVASLGPELLKNLVFTSFLLVVTFIDFDHRLILDKVLMWFAGAGVVINLFLIYLWGFFPGYRDTLDMIIGSLLGGGLMLLIAVVSRGGMGGGDVKFAAALGLWLGWKFTLMALLLSFLAGGVGGAVLLITRLKGRKDYIPFGPFIALGAFITMLYGCDILGWYMTRL